MAKAPAGPADLGAYEITRRGWRSRDVVHTCMYGSGAYIQAPGCFEFERLQWSSLVLADCRVMT